MLGARYGMSKSLVGGGIAGLVGLMLVALAIGWFGSRRASDFPTVSTQAPVAGNVSVPEPAVAAVAPVAPARPAGITGLKGLKLLSSAVNYEFRDDGVCILSQGPEEAPGRYTEEVSVDGQRQFRLTMDGSSAAPVLITWTAETDRYTGIVKVRLHYVATGKTLTFEVLRPKY